MRTAAKTAASAPTKAPLSAVESPVVPPHALGVDAVLDRLAASAAGLSGDAADDRLATVGPNRLPEPKGRGPLIRFLAQFRNLLVLVLIGAAVVTAALGHWIDTQVILAVVVVNAVIGFVQEGKAERALAALRGMLAPRATVLRDGKRQTIAGEDVVPGDVILLEAGDKVPADARLLTAHGLMVQEAALTGESVPVAKATDPVPADAGIGDRTPMVFSGTLVATGHARALVTATGPATEIGRIGTMLNTVETLTTPLIAQMDRFAKSLTLVILSVAAAVLAIGVVLRDQPFAEAFMTVVGLSVAAIPEGLPAILSVTLAIGVQAMARRHAIVRRLPVIETLGAVTTICSDKTGTLTCNQMMVATVALPDRLLTVSGTGYRPEGVFQDTDRRSVEPASDDHLQALAQAGLLCNDADLHPAADDGWEVSGDPMEGALTVLGIKAGRKVAADRHAWPRTDLLPFDSAHRWMATRNQPTDGGPGWVVVKGAPEVVFGRVTAVGVDGDRGFDTEAWHDEAERIAHAGQRVLAIAIHPVSAAESAPIGAIADRGLHLLGLVGLIDPPRPEAIAAVADCRAAGIDVKMITGDHAGTAAAIARQLGLARPGRVLTGADLAAMDDAHLRRQVVEVDVFARTSPEDKLRLVTALQARGQVVAMTGDGVNDAPALKRADIGIGMGHGGSEAAKEAADMVLADDNFATIAQAVKAGRTVYDNLSKAVSFLLPVNGGEAMSLILAILFALTLPITPLQILWVNMVSSVALAMALAFDPAARGVMQRPPRRPGQGLLSKLVVWRVMFVSILFSIGIFGKFALAQAQGASVEEARTIAVNTLVVMEIFYLLAIRGGLTAGLKTLVTPAVAIAITTVLVLQGVFTYLPAMEAFFDTRPLSLLQVTQIVSVGLAVLLILELERLVRRRWFERADRPAVLGHQATEG